MSNQFKLTGKIIKIGDIQTFSSGFTKREFVIEEIENERYPQKIKFEVLKDKCELLDRYRLGATIEVSFNVRGNEHNGRYFVNLVAWRIERPEEGQAAPQRAQEAEQVGDDDTDDIPF